jgi:hypothetical protein
VHWQKRENRKQFFMSFAEFKEMDPLLPSSWYNVTTEDLLKQKVASPAPFPSPFYSTFIPPSLPTSLLPLFLGCFVFMNDV